MEPSETLLHKINNEPGNITSIEHLLLQPGISINFKHPHDHHTALHLAVRHGCSGVVERLLLHGAHINITTTDLATPLHEACLSGDVACAELLIGAGAGVSGYNMKM